MSTRQVSDKLDKISRLLDVLGNGYKTLPAPQRNQILEQLKVFARDAQDAEPFQTKEAILILCRCSFDGDTGREGLKCLANVLLLKPSTRQYFVDLGYHSKAAEILKKDDNREDEFLASRLLFLCTYETKVDYTDLFKNGLAENLNQNLTRHAEYFAKLGEQSASPINSMALSESLKLCFNLSNFYPDQIPALSKSLPDICKIFATIKLLDPPLQPPVTHIINSFLKLGLEGTKNPLFPESDPQCHVDRLCSILDQSIRHHTEAQLEAIASPLLTLIRHLYSIAPIEVQEHVRSVILPSNEDRKTPLGKSDNFSSYILRLSLAGGAPQIRDSIQNLLFELSDKDANKFVRNVGYGFAAGFLFSHNIAIPDSALEAAGSSEDWSSASKHNGIIGPDGDSVLQPPKIPNNPSMMIPVNPITGQRLDQEKDEPVVEMTQEEKEREAERLFVLFERLRATGVMNVENPVIKAYQEGRIQEMPDDGEDD